MKSVWVMNLIDNRDNAVNSREKFERCFARNVVAIGWAGYDPGRGDSAFETAHSFLAEMQRGDLVWVRNPETKEQFLCEVLNDKVIPLEHQRDASVNGMPGQELHEFDISEGRICEYHSVNDDLLKGVDRNKLVARHTIQHMLHAETIVETWKIFDGIVAEEKK